MVRPFESMPDVAMSAPGNPWNMLSVDRFSCMMMTMCWMGVLLGGDVGVGSIGPGTAEFAPLHADIVTTRHASNAKRSTAGLVTGRSSRDIVRMPIDRPGRHVARRV